MRAVVVIPTYNERENILRVIPEVLAVLQGIGTDGHVLVVDDNSPDGTARVIEAMCKTTKNLWLLKRQGKAGLATAYLDGFRWSLVNIRPTLYGQMDADFSHPPRTLRNMVGVFARGYDVVVGSRYVEGGGSSGWSLYRKMVSVVANALARSLLGLDVRDATSGFRVLSQRAVEALLTQSLSSKGFVYQIECLCIFKSAGLKIAESPFVYQSRKKGGSKLTLREMLDFLKAVIKLKFPGM